MPPETLRCPACGAGVSSESTRCNFCGVALATIACPVCFGMMFAGAKFCAHCGAQGARSEGPGGETRLCPRCKAGMKAVTVGTTSLLECSACEGIWVDVATLQQICAEREKQAAVMELPAHPDEAAHLEANIRYLPCPICHNLMNRVNFAHCSHVIVNVCKAHGTWFDKDELRRTVEFIRGGGLEKARAQELAQIKDERRQLEAARIESTLDPGLLAGGRDSTFSVSSVASSSVTAIDLLFDLLS
jgi:Zn-finger nucleic acid-binding protein